MSKNDWYRRKTWTIEDRADFYARLKKSRGDFNKAQYARIQAYELQTVGTPDTLSAAVELLDMIIAEWRTDAQLAAVHQQYAQCRLRLGQQEKAIESFREVFRVQRQQPGHIAGAHLDFGWVCISAPLPKLFSEVLGVLDEFQFHPVFPAQIYRDAAIRAIIYRSQGKQALARDHARRALAVVSAKGPLPHNPQLGIVTSVEPRIHEQLISIAA